MSVTGHWSSMTSAMTAGIPSTGLLATFPTFSTSSPGAPVLPLLQASQPQELSPRPITVLPAKLIKKILNLKLIELVDLALQSFMVRVNQAVTTRDHSNEKVQSKSGCAASLVAILGMKFP